MPQALTSRAAASLWFAALLGFFAVPTPAARAGVFVPVRSFGSHGVAVVSMQGTCFTGRTVLVDGEVPSAFLSSCQFGQPAPSEPIELVSIPGTGAIVHRAFFGPEVDPFIVRPARLPDGSILVARTGGRDLVRLAADGTVVETFGDHGVASLGDVQVERILPAGGAVLVLGRSSDSTVIVRLDGSGRLDPGFGSGGAVTVQTPGGFVDLVVFPGAPSRTIRIVGSEIVVAYWATTVERGQPLTKVILSRFSEDGLLDATLGTNGTVVTEIATPAGSVLGPPLIQADGGLIAAVDDLDSGQRGMRRSLPDGTLDVRFGKRGFSRRPFDRRGVPKPCRGFVASIADLIEQNGGRVAFVGISFTGRLEDDQLGFATFGRRGNLLAYGCFSPESHNTDFSTLVQGTKILVSGATLERSFFVKKIRLR